MNEKIYSSTKIIANNIFSSYEKITEYCSKKIDPLLFNLVRNNSFNASSCYEDKECRISIDRTAIDVLYFYFSQVTDEYFKKINEKFTSNLEDPYNFSFESIIFQKIFQIIFIFSSLTFSMMPVHIQNIIMFSYSFHHFKKIYISIFITAFIEIINSNNQ